MGIISTAANAYFTFKFLRKLTQKWEDMEAFELGIIDADGKVLKKSRDLKTSEEKAAYTIFDRLAFNIKRILEKLPFGKTRIASYAAALYLLKEEAGLDDDQIDHILSEMGIDREDDLQEDLDWFVIEGNRLSSGSYNLLVDCVSPITGELAARKNSRVSVESDGKPVGEICGCPVYEVIHKATKLKLIVTSKDISR